MLGAQLAPEKKMLVLIPAYWTLSVKTGLYSRILDFIRDTYRLLLVNLDKMEGVGVQKCIYIQTHHLLASVILANTQNPSLNVSVCVKL